MTYELSADNPPSLTLNNEFADSTLGEYHTAGNAISVTLSSDGTKAYVADYSSGLTILDITTDTPTFWVHIILLGMLIVWRYLTMKQKPTLQTVIIVE